MCWVKMAARMPSSAEGKFARKLASNEAKVRNKALSRLRMYLTIRSKNDGNFDHLEMLKLWKGLYFCMWMADKPLVQEDLAENMASLLHCFHTPQQALLFLQVFYETMAREWSLIDRLRLDKFMMLVRKFFRGSLELVKRKKWSKKLAKELVQLMKKGPLNPEATNVPEGLQNHLSEVFMAEVKAMAEPKMSPDVLVVLLSPYLELMARTKRVNVHKAVCDGLFEALLRSAETGIQMTKKGQKPNLRIDCQLIADELLEKAIDRTTLGRNRKSLYDLKRKFQGLASGPSEVEAMVEVEGSVGESSSVEPSSGDEVQGKKKKKKKKKEVQEVLENGGHLSEESVDGVTVESEDDQQKKKRRKESEVTEVPSTATRESMAVSEQLEKGRRKRGAVPRKMELSQVEDVTEGETSEPKQKKKSKKNASSQKDRMEAEERSTPDEVEGDAVGLFADLSTGDWGDGDGELELPAPVSPTPIASTAEKRSGTKKSKKGQVKHVKTRMAGRVSSTITGDSSCVDSSVSEVGGDGGRESTSEQKTPPGAVKSDSAKRVSFVPQQLCTVQEFVQSLPVSPHIKPLAGRGPSQSPPTKPPKGIVKTPPTVNVLTRQAKRLKAADFF